MITFALNAAAFIFLCYLAIAAVGCLVALFGSRS
jgi:hypothetical protein